MPQPSVSLADQLRARARRCAELQARLDADPSHADAKDWIVDIGRNALTRQEERHVALVATIRRIRGRIARIESAKAHKVDLTGRIEALTERLRGMKATDPGYKRFAAKLARLTDRKAAPVEDEHKLAALRQRIEMLMASPELLDRADVMETADG